MGLNFNLKGEDKWDQIITGQNGQQTKPSTDQKLSTEQKPKRIDFI